MSHKFINSSQFYHSNFYPLYVNIIIIFPHQNFPLHSITQPTSIQKRTCHIPQQLHLKCLRATACKLTWSPASNAMGLGIICTECLECDAGWLWVANLSKTNYHAILHYTIVKRTAKRQMNNVCLCILRSTVKRVELLPQILLDTHTRCSH